MKLQIFTPEQLQPLVDEGKAGFVSTHQWIASFLNGVKTMVSHNPTSYRTFGPFWWPLKAMMQNAGLIGGEPVDKSLIEQADMGSPELNVAAAFAFQEWVLNSQIVGNTFPVTTDDGDTEDYTLIDEELEQEGFIRKVA